MSKKFSDLTAITALSESDILAVSDLIAVESKKITLANLRTAIQYSKTKFTPEGGLAIKLTNRTGAATIKGTVVHMSLVYDNAFATTPADNPDSIGVVYDNGVAEGTEAWVVISGRAQVLLQDGTASTRGYWVRGSATVAGRADATQPLPPGGTIVEIQGHLKEIGHCAESKAAGTNVLAYIIIHFN